LNHPTPSRLGIAQLANRNLIMDSSKFKSTLLVLEGFGVLIVFHMIGGYYFAPRLVKIFSEIPLLTISMITSSAISPVMAILYLALRNKFIPKFSIKRGMFAYILSGIMLAWLIVFINMLFSVKEISFAKEILESPSPYYYLNLFLLILWGPFLEEILFRGYLFELLKPSWGDPMSLLLSSTLFVMPHGIFGFFDITLISIFLYSIVFTLLYMYGGLIASISVHAFVNLYLLYLNV
jgi:membrane protease YdiL (CAAX protease family)